MKTSKSARSLIPAHRPEYFISNRPEAYEMAGEISAERAAVLASLIARRASECFPGIDFKIDSQWHTHDPELDGVAAFIESHWVAWAADAPGKRKARA